MERFLLGSEQAKHFPVESHPEHLYPHEVQELFEAKRPELHTHYPVNCKVAPLIQAWQIKGFVELHTEHNFVVQGEQIWLTLEIKKNPGLHSHWAVREL